MRRFRGNQGGFTLIEVLIASAIAVASMGVLLALFSSGLERMARIEINAQQLIAEKEIVARLSQVNPAMQAEGRGRAGGWAYAWRARPVTEFQQISADFGLEGPVRSVALFLVSVDMEKDGNRTADFEFRKLGWRQ